VLKRPKIDPDHFSWVVSVRGEANALWNKCAATRDLIVNYTLNVKLTKAHLLNFGCTPEFPDAEWRPILLRLAVNLDSIFSSRYSTEHDTMVTQEIRDFTISTCEASISKAVKSARDWFIP
jgi:hypothetical protein